MGSTLAYQEEKLYAWERDGSIHRTLRQVDSSREWTDEPQIMPGYPAN